MFWRASWVGLSTVTLYRATVTLKIQVSLDSCCTWELQTGGTNRKRTPWKYAEGIQSIITVSTAPDKKFLPFKISPNPR